MLHELIGLKNNRLDLGKGDGQKINIEAKDFNVNDLKVQEFSTINLFINNVNF